VIIYLSSIVLHNNNPCLSADRENGLTFPEQNITATDNTALLKFIS